MKRIIIVSIVCFIFLLSNHVYGRPKNRTSLFAFSWGMNTFSPGFDIPDADPDDYGGSTMLVRMLIKSGWIHPRIILGGEFGWITLIQDWKQTSLIHVDSGKRVVRNANTYPLQFLIGYLITEGRLFSMHAVVGLGGVSVKDIFPGADVFRTEFAFSLKLLTGISLWKKDRVSLSLDPEVNWLNSLGPNKISAFSMLVGLSFNILI